ncbi:MAG TPA: amidohydrolase, partial [Anaeromyxobacteraceae bacterium]|nr:amidohydrolase [Anaeromyxobacteraceae bacterium]
MTARVVAAPWVLPGPDLAAIRDGAVALDGDVVVAVGPRAEVEARHGAAEAVDAVLLPALVNAHLHLELGHLAGKVPGGRGLVPWI